ncbi:uncharacterized protein [Branchiostoma lanceolatum]|uniref:uncharacterized protein n=1 Tax=Branchiostoma lanceolatum TaxID=7740 RepID=UPI00345493A3
MAAKGVGEYFHFLKEAVSTKWEDLAFFLNFKTTAVRNIKRRNDDDMSRCKDMLEIWEERDGDKATMDVLMKALSKAGLGKVRDDLKKEISRNDTGAKRTSRKRPSDNQPPPKAKKMRGSKRQQNGDGAGPSQSGAAKVDVTQYFDKVISSVSYKWDDLARKLGFERGEIKAIENTPALRDPNQRCREMLERWERSKAGGATLRILKQALIDIDERKTAESL